MFKYAKLWSSPYQRTRFSVSAFIAFSLSTCPGGRTAEEINFNQAALSAHLWTLLRALSSFAEPSTIYLWHRNVSQRNGDRAVGLVSVLLSEERHLFGPVFNPISAVAVDGNESEDVARGCRK